jgi:hypothetical protein
MKKFWIVLLALGLVAGFAMSASAVDVKFSGSYYVGGFYVDKPSMDKDQNTYVSPTTGLGQAGAQAFYYQRLRVQTEFRVAEGLNLVTRFDALERRWGDNRWMGTGDTYNRTNAAGTVQIQENIEFERAYLDFTTKIGRFMVGYMNFVSWGTSFHDSDISRAGIKYIIPIGPLTVIAAIEKPQGGDSNVGTGTASDADNQVYDLGAIYKFGAGDAGLIYQKGINKTARPTANRYSDLNIFIPYAKAKLGPVFIEGEAVVGFGDLRKWDGAAAAGSVDVSAQQYALYLHAKADIGPAYVGGRFVYLSGDDPTTNTKVEGGLFTPLVSGDSFNPCLIMWNTQYTKWVSQVATRNASSTVGVNPFTGNSGGMDTYLDNAWIYQIYGGFKPTPKLDIMASVTYAYADKKPYSTWTTAGAVAGTEFLSDQYGTEIDLVAKYKIFDNLEYMAGFAYMLTGDYFKGSNANFNKSDNYLLMHQLTLTF